MWVYVCVYAHTHTHCTDGVLGYELRSRDETPGELEESRSTKGSIHVDRIGVQSAFACIYAGLRV